MRLGAAAAAVTLIRKCVSAVCAADVGHALAVRPSVRV